MAQHLLASDPHATVAGGGLVGSLLTILLAQRGFQVQLFERRPDIRQMQFVGGRSINLALSDRGLKALALTGLEKEVRELCIPMYGRVIHEVGKQDRFMQYGKDGQAINSISRGGLNKLLMQYAGEMPNVQLQFNTRCLDYNTGSQHLQLQDSNSGETQWQHAGRVFATDGAFSALRMAIMRKEGQDFQLSQEYLPHAYKELSIPATEDGGWRLDKEALHIWPRKSFMIIALPNLDGSFTVTLFLARTGEVSFENLQEPDQVQAFFEQYFPDLIDLIPDYLEQWIHNPTSLLITTKVAPWHVEDKLVLLGDAAHPIVPFYGQGMNAGFEDCYELMQLMDKSGDYADWHQVFEAFSTQRKPNGDAVANLALRNFIEMRDLVADPDFILKNTIDKKMGHLFPDQWMPLYSMVTFSDMPYSEAWRLGLEHDQILQKITEEIPTIALDIHTQSDSTLSAMLSDYCASVSHA